jgi:hypothetical protein
MLYSIICAAGKELLKKPRINPRREPHIPT